MSDKHGLSDRLQRVPLVLGVLLLVMGAPFATAEEVTWVRDEGGDYTFVVPADVNQITVEMWGAGGRGGRYQGGGSGGRGGGGGGAFATSTILVLPGETLTVRVGAGGSGTGNTPAPGGDSWLRRVSDNLVLAKGGSSVGNATDGGAGGAGASSIGELTFSGGNGAAGTTEGTIRGGGGGSSAGRNDAGNSATSHTGASAPSGGGSGGNGNTGSNADGQAGSGPGGGGGGASKSSSSGGGQEGGNGADGRVVLRFTPDPSAPPPDDDDDTEPEPEPEPPPPPPGDDVSISQTPLFLSAAVNPQVMLNLSNDHQLYFAAYDDYSDLTGDGLPDTTYKHDFDYYGYFDPYKCYVYDNSSGEQLFVPVAETSNKYCTGQWSGNFLNWISMARIDTVRKILYGGTRSTDTAARTVLERTHLPTDAHSWAKYYNGADLALLTPFADVITGFPTQTSGITFCNTTRPDSTVLSQDTNAPPLIRVARGNYSLWASNERWQCKWRDERSGMLSGFSLADGTPQAGSNGNIPAISGIPASPENPRRVTDGTDPGVGLGNGLRQGEFIARVEACVEGLEGTERCKRYPSGNLKPVGILQLYGDDDLIDFGLMTGSYNRNKSGGVLRKNVSSFRNEVNVNTDGTFRPQPATGGIVGTLDRFRIYGYRHRNPGTYFGEANSDDCSWGLSTFPDGRCSNWGNPQAEIYLESLRYFGGQSADPNFDTDDSGRIAGLLTADWNDPVSDDNFCAPLNVIQFNASTTSYDGNQLARANQIGLASVTAATDAIGVGEGIHGAEWFVGTTPGNSNQLCSAKTINSLGAVTGTCPDAPRLEGTYNIAGLAHHAWTQGVRDDLRGNQFVKTFGVTLAPAVPRAVIPVPGSSDGRVVTLLPACRNTSLTPDANCAIVDFKIVEQDFAAGTGSFYVNWEDSEQGGDFDSDMWGMIRYAFEGNVLRITTQVVAQSTPNRMGFGYIISGTDNGDGFRVHSGNANFVFTDPNGFPDCSSGCRAGDPETTAEYIVGGSGSAAGLLEQPLWYAAKWGGFDKSEGDLTPARQELWDSTGDGVPDNYVLAVNPAVLEEALDEAFLSVLVTTASAASVATNSTRLDADAAIYQARFNSERWSGEMLAFGITSDGQVEPEPIWNAATRLDAQAPATRRILSSTNLLAPTTADPVRITTTGINFQWDELSEAQRNALRQGLTTEELAAGLDEERLLFLRGKRSLERTTANQALPFRRRDSVLGDIVNSNPQFVGTQDFGYGGLGPNDAFATGVGAAYAAYRSANVNRVPLVVVGANDGMLHAFDARVDDANLATGGREVFAYVPASIYGQLHDLTRPDYVHRYYVDGTPRVADAYLGADKGWRKVVAGTTGAGGRSVFMLDVSNPENISSADVLWEFRHLRLGVPIGQPSVVPLSNGRFGVVVSSGYNNGTSGRVFVLDAATGAIIFEFDTGESSSGMGTPLVIDTTGNAIADRIYVGDMEGRLWRFDMPRSNQNDTRNWGAPGFLVDRVSGTNFVRPLAIVRGPNDEVQPITAQPEGGRNQDGNIMLFFGTGTFFRNGDNIVGSNPDVQSFYGIVDRGERVHSRTGLTEQEVLLEERAFGRDLRVVSKNELTGVYGWYMDLLWKQSRSGPGAIGERVTQRAILRGGRIIFTTLIPSANACDFGGSSWLMELDAFTGARIERPVFDLDGDGYFDDSDMITVVIDGESVQVAPSGQMPDGAGLLSQPTILSAGEREYKFLSGSTGQIETITERGSDDFGRHSWRELR